MKSFCKSIVLLFVCGVFGAVTDEKSVSVNEGESVTLHTHVTAELKDNDKIRWRFGEEGNVTLITEMTGDGSIKYKDLLDGRFKDRLQILDLQTGHLIIKNIRHKHSGRYKVDYESISGTTNRIFRVTVRDAPRVIGAEQSDVKSERVIEGDSVTLNTAVQTQRDDLILWRFGDEGVLLAKGDKDENKDSIYDDVLDGMFRDRLKLDDQTGSLTITNTKTTDTGVFKLQIINNRDSKYRTFSVSVSERGLSAGQVTGIICGVLLLVIVVGVIMFRRIKYKQQKLKVKEMTVLERHSVTLETHVTKPQSDDVIQWSFRDEVIAIFNKNNSDEERLIDRLQVDDQTGSLTITNIRKEDAGLYKVKISSSSRLKSFLQFIIGGGPSYYQFNVLIKERIKTVELRDSVTLKTDVTGIKTGDVIQWTFEDEKNIIAVMTGGTKPSVERFTDRLKMDPQTGDLTITDITAELSGVYRAKIISSSRGSKERDYRVAISEFTDKGESLTLYPESEIQRDSEIKWIYEDKTILETVKNGGDKETKYIDDERFKGRLKMNHKTGDLNIRDIRQTDDGLYTLKINSDGKISCRIFRVYVRERVKSVVLEDSVTLETGVTEIQTDDVIQWRFGDEETIITKMTVGTKPSYVSTDKRFTDRLMMKQMTGHLTIIDFTSELSGVYIVQIISSSRDTEFRTYRVVVSASRSPSLMRLNSGNESTTVLMPLPKKAEDTFLTVDRC
ncbi:hypothetical protein E1301_Tti013461 [Triplophysa tibetana]|uniref:Ig-like domain-containing protein n=1 Tax=Triplophysa tibetana TaxID=1572043 RepID=A0A5A9NSH5_9TELE|nr:hypothetical protein E1301_Tti013461 [Triplophysa tibetana]